MRALLIGPHAKERAAQIVEWSAAHPWHPGADNSIPGDSECSVLTIQCATGAGLGLLRAVYSLTILDGRSYQHLTISIENGQMPHPALVEEVARLFAFGGPASGWSIEVRELRLTLGDDVERPYAVVCVVRQL